MANIEFTDWNNYTDRNGTAQTLDWNALPSFLDISIPMKALIESVNEKAYTSAVLLRSWGKMTASDYSATYLNNDFFIEHVPASWGGWNAHYRVIQKNAFYQITNLIDFAINDLVKFYFNPEDYPRRSNFTLAELISLVEAEAGETWIETEYLNYTWSKYYNSGNYNGNYLGKFYTINTKWLQQRKIALDFLYICKGLFATDDGLLNVNQFYGLQIISDNGSGIPTYGLTDSLRMFECQVTNGAISEYRYNGFKYDAGNFQQLDGVFADVALCCQFDLPSDFTGHDTPIVYEDLITSSSYGDFFEYLRTGTPIDINASFDIRDYRSTPSVGSVDLTARGYQKNADTLNNLEGQYIWAYHMNVIDGFKFQP